MPDLTDFGGGLYLPGEADSPNPQPGFAIPPNGLLKADNVEFLAGGGLRGRRGRTRYNATPLLGPIIGLARHYPRDGAVTGIHAPVFADTLALAGSGASWATPPSARALDDNVASVTLAANTYSDYLRLQGFSQQGVTPANIVPTGIRVFLYVKAGPNAAIHDHEIRLLKAGAPVGINLAQTEAWDIRTQLRVYGGPGELWGTTWALGDLDGAFGVAIAARSMGTAQVAQVDAVAVQFFFTGASDPVTLVATTEPGGLFYRILDGIGGVAPILGGNAFNVPTARPHFVQWPEQQSTFIVDGTNPPLQYFRQSNALTQVQRNPDGLPLPKGPYAALWRSRLWVTSPTELQFSVYGSEVDDPTTYFSDSQFSVNDADGGTITGLLALPDRLLVAKDTCWFYFVGDILSGAQVSRFTDRGCIAPNTIALTPAGVIFLGRGGLYLTDGESPDPIDISAPLSSLFNDRGRVRDFPNAVGVYYPTSNQYWLKLDPAALDGYVLQRTRQLDGSFRLAWAHMPVMPLNAATVLTGSGDEGQLYIGDTAGVVRQADVGALDDGQPIACEIATASITLDRSQRQGRICYVKTKARGIAGLDGGLRYDGLMADQLTFAVDGQPPVPAGVGLAAVPIFHHRRATITDMGIFGRSVAVRLRNPTDGPEFELHQITLDATMRSMQRWP